MAGPAEIIHGKVFIGLILNVLLFGINITQTYFYYIHSKKDRLWIKIWVIVIFLADFIQPLFCLVYLYQTLIVNFGDIPRLLEANNVFAIVPTMTGLTGCIVQLFFAWRIRILTNNWYYVTFIAAAALSGGVCGILLAYEGSLTPRFVEFRTFKVVVLVGMVSEMLADIMITSILVWFLHKHKSGFRRSDKMVERIICFTIRTGLMTLIFTGLNMAFYLIDSGGTDFLLNLILSKLYTSSLLSSLNSRRGWGYDTSEGTEDQITDFSLRFAGNGTSEIIASTTPGDSRIESGVQERHEAKPSCVAEPDGGVSVMDDQWIPKVE